MIFYLFLKNFINNTIIGILFAIVAGIMLNISLCKLLPTTNSYNYKKVSIIFFAIGILFILIKFM